MAIFDWIRSRYGANTKELIYSPAGSRQLKNGAPHYYTGAVRAGHFNHVHWAYDSGGVARGSGVFPKLTNAPERILSPRQTSAFEGLVRNLEAGGGRNVSVTLVAPNYVGSRTELRNALVDIARDGRLAAILRGRV